MKIASPMTCQHTARLTRGKLKRADTGSPDVTLISWAYPAMIHPLDPSVAVTSYEDRSYCSTE